MTPEPKKASIVLLPETEVGKREGSRCSAPARNGHIPGVVGRHSLTTPTFLEAKRELENVLTCLKSLRQEVLADCVYQKAKGVDLAIAAVESMPKEN